ncbi:hypothetical protein YC2023_034896 [Brassica napus]
MLGPPLFEKEVLAKLNETVMDMFSDTFCCLPLAHALNRKIIVLHGGLFSRDGVTLSDIKSIQRFCQPPKRGLMRDLLWSDPQDSPGRSESTRGEGIIFFGEDVTVIFERQQSRSHELKDKGYEINHNSKLITVFSAPNYCDRADARQPSRISRLGLQRICRVLLWIQPSLLNHWDQRVTCSSSPEALLAMQLVMENEEAPQAKKRFWYMGKGSLTDDLKSFSVKIKRQDLGTLVLLILLAAIVLAFYFLPVEQLLRDFLLWVEQDLGPWGPLALCELIKLLYLFNHGAVAYIPLTVLAVPASVLTVYTSHPNSFVCCDIQIGSGYLFGLPIGFVADSVGATLGSGAAFLLGRTIGKPFVVAKLKDYPQFQSVALAIEKSGFKHVELPLICNANHAGTILAFFLPITLALVYVGTTLKDLSDVTHKWSELSFGHWASLILSLVVAQNALRKALAEHGGDMNIAVAASPELNDVVDAPADLNEPLLIKIDSQSPHDHENRRVMREAAG